MVLVDTSVWVEIFRDLSGGTRAALSDALTGDDVTLSRFTELELLQGCRDEREWKLLRFVSGLAGLPGYVSLFLARSGSRVLRSPPDGSDRSKSHRLLYRPTGHGIHDILLLHRDGDFEVIAEIRPLSQIRLGSAAGLTPGVSVMSPKRG